MAKTISLSYEGVEYTLEYTRKSVEIMEKQGFNINEVAEKPVSLIPSLFAGAFLAHHRFVKPETINEIYSQIGNKEQLIAKLAEMYSEPIESLLDEPGEGKNLAWGASW